MVTVDKATGAAGPPWRWRSVWPAAVVALAFAPLLVIHARMLWARPHYKFFPLVFPGAAALVWQACRRLGPLEPGSRKLAGLATAAGWGLLALGVLFVSPGFGAVGALVTLAAGVYALGGPALAKTSLPAWGFLWLAVPLPRRFDTMLVTGLQDLVSRWSSQFLDAFRVFHVMEGNVVEVAGRRLLVDQACSGIYSLLTLLLGTLFYALWNRTSVPRALFLMAAAVFWVVFGNVARIVAIVLLSVRFGIDASVGLKHEALGLLVFVLMLAMVASTDRLYAFAASVLAKSWGAGRPSGAEAAAGRDRGPTVLTDPRGTWVGSLRAASAFGLLLLPQWAMPGVDWNEVLTTHDVYAPLIGSLVETSLPAKFEGFERMAFRAEHREMDDSWGENSRTWYYRYEKGPGYAALSLDYQFVDWHDLTLCYTGQGWTMQGSRVGALGRSGSRDARSLVEADFINLEGRHGHLIYGLFNRKGRVVTPPEARGFVQTLIARLRSWLIRSSHGSEAADGLNFQYQIFIDSDQPPSAEARDQALVFFEETKALAYKKAFAVAAETEGGLK